MSYSDPVKTIDSCERPSLIWKVVVLVGALAIVAAALFQGVLNGSN